MESIEADIKEEDGSSGVTTPSRTKKRHSKRQSSLKSKPWTGPSSGPSSSSSKPRSLKGSLRRRYRSEIPLEEAQSVAATVIQSWWRMVTSRRVFLLIQQSAKFRSRIVQEMVDTERTYLNILQILVNEFELPLSQTDILTPDERKTIFGGLTVILGFSQQLCQDLTERFASWHIGATIGDIFLRVTPFFRAYSLYVQSYPAAIALVTRLASNPRWVEFEKAVFKRVKMSRATLPSLLITPVQRVPRYLLLIRDLMKHTDPLHPDSAGLKMAHDKIEETATHINNQAIAAEKLMKLSDIAVAVEDCPLTLVEAGRKFEREGLLCMDQDGKMVHVYAYLFSDMIVCCTNKEKGRRKFYCSVSLSDTSVDRQDDVTFSLIRDEGKEDGQVTETVFIAPDAVARQDWIKSISGCITTLRQHKEKIMEYKYNVASSRAEQAKALISARYATGTVSRVVTRRGTITGQTLGGSPVPSQSSQSIFPVAALGISESGADLMKKAKKSSKKSSKKTAKPSASDGRGSLRKWSASLTQSEAKQWRKMDPLEKRDATNRAMEDLKQLEAEKLAAQQESLEKAAAGKQQLQSTLTQKTGRLSYRESRASLRRTPTKPTPES